MHLLADWKDNVLGEQIRSAESPYGFKLVVRNHPANRAMLKGEFETEETTVILDHLSRADVFIDIGANIGFYTCLALKAGRRVIAVEPQARNLQCLYASLEANHWLDLVEVFPVGLGTSPAISVLYGASGPSASLVRNWANYDPKYRQMIPITTLDILLGERFLDRRALVKIDVEGYEFQVLQGAAQFARRSPRPSWLVEICFDEYHPAGLNPTYQMTFEWFWERGYEARTANRDSRLIRPSDVDQWCQAKRCDSGTINYLFAEPKSETLD
jgi:FkbM family methyltransferase